MLINTLKEKTVILYALQGVLLAFFVNTGQAAPSFNCAKANTPSEKLICHPESQQLAQLDAQLTKQYRDLRKSLDKDYRQFLRSSQISWLTYRDNLCFSAENPSIHNSRNCLEKLYRSRVNELENGVIFNNIATATLPVVLVLPDGKKIRFTSKDSKHYEEETQTTTKKNTFKATLGTEEILLGVTRESNSVINRSNETDTVVSIRFGFHRLTGLFFVIEAGHGSGVAAAGYNWGGYKTLDLIVNINNKYKKLEPIQFGGHGSHGATASNATSAIRWHTDDKGKLSVPIYNTYFHDHANQIGRTKVTLYSIDTTTGSLHQQRDYVFQDMETGSEQVKEKYIKYYTDLTNQVGGVKISGCSTNKQLDKARFKLFFYLSLLSRKQVSWAQILYAASKLAGQDSDIKLTNEFVLLAREMQKYRLAIEATPDWEKKFKRLNNYSDHIDFSQSEFPVADKSCLGQYVSGRAKAHGIGSVSLEEWLYGFWYRRYRDNSYANVVKVVDLIVSKHAQ